MNQVRDVCDRMLDGAAPPMREPARMLAAARRSARRRDAVNAAGVAATVLVMIGAAVLAGVRLTGGGPVMADRPTASTISNLSRPPARAAAAQDQRMAEVIAAAVPAPLHVAQVFLFGSSTTVVPTRAPDHSLLLAGALIRVSNGDKVGQVVAYIVADQQPAPIGDDLCSPGPWTPATGTCTTTLVHGVPIQLVHRADAAGHAVIVGTRFLAGGQLSVAAWQAVPTTVASTALGGLRYAVVEEPIAIGSGPALDRAPLTGEQVAAVAADPGMLQFP